MAPTRWRAFAGGSAERLCEAACRRGSIDQPVSIRALKRFVTDQFGGRATPLASFPADECDGLEEAVHLARCLASRDYRRPAPGERVAIIGSGPAGLAAAHDLALVCFSPVVFEMESKPAGMLYTGIPAYRLPREPIDAEVELIRALGWRAVTVWVVMCLTFMLLPGTLLGVWSIIAISGQHTASSPSAIVVERRQLPELILDGVSRILPPSCDELGWHCRGAECLKKGRPVPDRRVSAERERHRRRTVQESVGRRQTAPAPPRH